MLIFSLDDWAEAVNPVVSRASSTAIRREGKPYLSTGRAGAGLNA
jgi:hypothetical protein